MHYIFFYKTVEGYIEKRVSFREEHLKLAQTLRDNGSLVMADALADPADGAMLVFKGDNPSVAEEFTRNDPYL